MSTELICPSCGHRFEPNEAIREEVQRELRTKMTEWQKQQQAKYDSQLAEEKKKTQQETESQIRKSIAADFENKLRIAEQANKENEEKLKLARQKELEFLKKEQELKTKEEELELSVQKELQKERAKLSEEIRKIEEQKIAARETEHQLRERELVKQLDDQKKLVEEMRRKQEQGSMQLQGESQELLLEELLKERFPFDTIEEVGKGVEGADCILVVRNNQGHECGKIIFESKRTKGWNNAWIDKLKNDMRKKGAELAILVSQVYPKGMECFGEKDGVWIANFREVIHLTVALRNAIIRVAETKKSEDNKGEKVQMLYNYLTGLEFRQQFEAIVEGFMSMRNAITKERVQMEKIWKEREKQIDKVLLSTSGMYGSIKGIAGASVQDIPLLESSENGNGSQEEVDI